MGFHRSIFFQTEQRIQFRSHPMRFLGFSNYEKGALRQEISKWSTVCRTFSRSGWSVVRSASLAKGGTLKKRPSPHLHKVRTRNNEVSPRTFQTALLYSNETYGVITGTACCSNGMCHGVVWSCVESRCPSRAKSLFMKRPGTTATVTCPLRVWHCKFTLKVSHQDITRKLI
jgi:hypothetical protein